MHTLKHRGMAASSALIASAFVGLITALGFIVMPTSTPPSTAIFMEPTELRVASDDTFEVRIVVRAGEPTNVFAGEVFFDHNFLHVDSIAYNTSIAELWAETPWYSNGDGTLNFAGGTTKQGGFEGEGTLLTIRFKSLQEGQGKVTMNTASIFLNDGLGTETPITKPLDAIVTIAEHEPRLAQTESAEPDITHYEVVGRTPSTDLNGDGKQTIADISIFMINLAGSDVRYDFNLDGKVDLIDLNILLSQ